MSETRKTAGSLSVRGRIAYVEQEPFIFSGTIEENITFGLQYDTAHFQRAIEASLLEKDLPNFSNGQNTVIGDRGVNISGG